MHIYISYAVLKWAGLFLFVLSVLALFFGNLPDHRGLGWANALRWLVWPLFVLWGSFIFIRGLVL